MTALAELFDLVTRAVVSLLVACAMALVVCIASAILIALGVVFAIFVVSIMSIMWARHVLFGTPAK